MSTTMEKITPTGPVAAEALENDFRAYYFATKIKGGAGVMEALDDVNKVWRDYSNITPIERGVVRNLPILFYNFTKQNTIAQMARFLDNPAYGAQWMKALKAMGDDLPEENKPQWMNAFNSFGLGSKAWYMSDEFAAPLEFFEPLNQLLHGNLGKGFEGMARSAPPAMRAVVEVIGEAKPFKFYGSVARKYFDRWGPSEGNIKATQNELGEAKLEISGGMAIALHLLGLETAAKVAMRPLERVHEGHPFWAVLEWITGVKGYDKQRPLDSFLGGGAKEINHKVADAMEGLSMSPGFGTFIREVARDPEHYDLLVSLVSGFNGKYWSSFLTQVRSALKEIRAESSKPGIERLPLLTEEK
jgi:hypothetical protein